MIEIPSILLFSGVRGDTRRYRTFHPFQQLRIAGLPGQLSHLTDPNLEVQLQNAAIAILHRVPMNRQVEKLISNFHSRGGLAIYDADDLIFDLDAFKWIDSPDFQDPTRARLYLEDMQRYRDTLNTCDAMTVSTEYLAGRSRTLGKPVWVHRNAFSNEMEYYSQLARAAGKVESNRIVVGYAAGTPTHQKDFNQIKDVLGKLLKLFPQTEIYLLGDIKSDVTWNGLGYQYTDRIHVQPRVSWRQLPFVLAQWDINLAPLLVDNPFNQSKSEIKYVEAGLVGIPTIASPTDSFKYAIKTGNNGYLAVDNDKWLEGLEALLEKNHRNQIGKQAYDHTLENYQPEVRAKQLVQTLTDICKYFHKDNLIDSLMKSIEPPLESQKKDREKKAYWVDLKFEQHPTLIEMGFYNLQNRSIWTLIQQAWVYFRRMIVPIFPYRQSHQE